MATPVPAQEPERAQSRFIDSVRKTTVVVGTLLIILTAARNSVTWHLQRFWGASGDFWERSWNYVYQDVFNENDYNITVYGTQLFAFAVFWLANSGMMLMYIIQPKCLLKYKIQDTVPLKMTRHQIVKTIGVVLFNQVVTGFLFSHFSYYLARWRGCPLAAAEIPTFHWVVLELCGLIAVEEIGFYYSHRLLHHPAIYKHVHKLHHEYTAPVSWLSIYAHPIEHICSNLGPPFLGLLLFRSHLATGWLWWAMVIMSTTVSHCGFHLPFLPSPEAHDFHHLKFNNCFGVMGVLDRLHGTDTAFRASKAYDRHFMMLSLVPVKVSYPDPTTKGQKGQKAE